MTPEQLLEKKAKDKAYREKRKASRTPEQIAEKKAKDKAYNIQRRSKMTPEELEADRARKREVNRKSDARDKERVKIRNKKSYEKNKHKDVEKKKAKRSAANKRYYAKNWQKINKRARLWAIKNAETIKANKDPEKERAYARKYYLKNKKASIAYSKNWRHKNPEKSKALSRRSILRNKKRRETDPLFAAKQRLRWAIVASFQRIKQNKPTNTEALLGCSWSEAKEHIEKLFQPGMSWCNCGPEWHIDHIRPVSSFREDELHLMNHISNLQPLWAEDNFKKSDKWDGKE